MKQFWYFLFTWWKGQTFGTWWHTRLNGEFVGEDEFGNRYYRTKGGAIDKGLGFQRRWVIYVDDADGSAVPPGWHGWLHNRVDTPPTEEDYTPWEWQKPHRPNQTGTPNAHRPQGSILTGAAKPAGTAGYQAWQPE